MKDKIEKRIASLKAEFESGKKTLSDLEAKQTNIRETLLRISGAIQILEELLAESQTPEENNAQNLEENATSTLISSRVE
ncbi:MAG: hypothetical protein F6K25_15945 [Okeania sp. SIO2G4]|uniref:hypothetical protein n=1 Tax=unclassified Okeania TaxID=2634635 RepID=UPI0013BC182C|nr:MULTISPECIES: hypothetical protein [unclassified Okeania]NEP73685.1 hypothetical protein [Okeania sp. SIO2G5]NEP94496.1 hypothetical protein [Okeania sp. SIO2F5]NEQ92108.1 hypothetical protein [Okeania sp. SIO2G4]